MKRKKTDQSNPSFSSNPKTLSGESLSRYVTGLFEERGRDAFETSKRALLEEAEKLECREVRKAIQYLTTYWKDTTRPALLSIACEALGGDPRLADSVSPGLVLMCEAVDLHDDVIDESVKKAGHYTLYGKYGKEITMLVGDALLLKGFRILHGAEEKLTPLKMDAILKVITELFFELGDAEAQELSFRGKTNITVEEYVSMVRKKAADFEAYMRISAILANAPEQKTEALATYGRTLGMLVILGDDNLDMFDPGELVNRILNEGLPLPILIALQDRKLREKLLPMLEKKKITKKQAESILNLVYDAKVFDGTGVYLKRLIEDGIHCLESISCSGVLEAILRSTYPE